MRLRGALRGGIAVSREARSNSLSSAVEIEWAPCSGARRFHDVQINHRRGDTGVSHQLLDHADVDALFEEMGGEAVAKRVETRLFRDGGLLDRVTEAALEALFAEVIPGDMVGARVDALPIGGKDPLPRPLEGFVGVLFPERGSDMGLAPAALEPSAVRFVTGFEVGSHPRFEAVGKRGSAVFAAFAVVYVDDSAVEVDVFYPQAQDLALPHPGPVGEFGDESPRIFEV